MHQLDGWYTMKCSNQRFKRCFIGILLRIIRKSPSWTKSSNPVCLGRVASKRVFSFQKIAQVLPLRQIPKNFVIVANATDRASPQALASDGCKSSVKSRVQTWVNRYIAQYFNVCELELDISTASAGIIRDPGRTLQETRALVTAAGQARHNATKHWAASSLFRDLSKQKWDIISSLISKKLTAISTSSIRYDKMTSARSRYVWEAFLAVPTLWGEFAANKRQKTLPQGLKNQFSCIHHPKLITRTRMMLPVTVSTNIRFFSLDFILQCFG